MKRIGIKLLRFLPIFVLILLLCLHCRYAFSLANERDEVIPELAANIVLCVINAFIYYSFLKISVAYDVSTDPPAEKENTFLYVIKNPGLYVSTFLVVLYDVIFTSSLSSRLNYIIRNRGVSVLISILFIVIVSFIVWFVYAKKHFDIIDDKKTNLKNTVVKYVITYVSVSLLSSLIPMLTAQVNVFAFIGRFVIIGLFIFAAVYFTVRYLKAFAARRLFLSKLKTICAENGYEITNMYRPYLSVFFDNGKINFILKNKDNVTEHKLLSCLNRSCNVLLFEEGGIIKDLPVKLGRNIVLFSFRHRQIIESEKCCIIYTSPPYNAVNGTANGKEIIDNDMTVGNMTYFTSAGFLNTLERKQIKQ